MSNLTELFSGAMYKCGGKVKSWNKRVFVLKSDCHLYYYKGTSKVPLGNISLHDPNIKVRRGEPRDVQWPVQAKPVCRMVVETTLRNYCLYTDYSHEIEEWLDVLTKAVRDADKARGNNSKEVKKENAELLDTKTQPPSSKSPDESSPTQEIESVYALAQPEAESLAGDYYVDVETPTNEGGIEESLLYERVGAEPQDIYDSVQEVIADYNGSGGINVPSQPSDTSSSGQTQRDSNTPPLLPDRNDHPDSEDPSLSNKENPPPLPEKEEGPPPLPEKEEGPPPLPEKEEGPPPLPENEEGPPPLPEKEEGPPPLPEKEEGLPLLPEKEEGSLLLPEKEEGSPLLPEKEEGPPGLPEKEGPPPLPEKEEGPPLLPEKEGNPPLPEKEGNPPLSEKEGNPPFPEKEEGPPPLPEKEEGPPPLPEKEEGPPPLPEKEEGPPPLPEKEEGPPLPEKEVLSQNGSPNKEEYSEVSVQAEDNSTKLENSVGTPTNSKASTQDPSGSVERLSESMSIPRNNSYSVPGLVQELHSGVLHKCGGKIKSWTKRFFVLKSDYNLYYYKDTSKGPLGTISLMDPKFKARKGEASDVSWPKAAKKECRMAVVTSLRTFTMYCDSAQDIKAWLQALIEAAEAAARLREEQNTRGKWRSVSSATIGRSEGESEVKPRPFSTSDVPQDGRTEANDMDTIYTLAEAEGYDDEALPTSGDPDSALYDNEVTPTSGDPDSALYDNEAPPTSGNPDSALYDNEAPPTSGNPDSAVRNNEATPISGNPVLHYSEATPTSGNPDYMYITTETRSDRAPPTESEEPAIYEAIDPVPMYYVDTETVYDSVTIEDSASARDPLLPHKTGPPPLPDKADNAQSSANKEGPPLPDKDRHMEPPPLPDKESGPEVPIRNVPPIPTRRESLRYIQPPHMVTGSSQNSHLDGNHPHNTTQRDHNSVSSMPPCSEDSPQISPRPVPDGFSSRPVPDGSSSREVRTDDGPGPQLPPKSQDSVAYPADVPSSQERPIPRPRKNSSSSNAPSSKPRSLTEYQVREVASYLKEEGDSLGQQMFLKRRNRIEEVAVESRRTESLQITLEKDLKSEDTVPTGQVVTIAETLREVEQERQIASEERFRWERERKKLEEERLKFEEEKRKMKEELLKMQQDPN